jgi:sterol desaturase/sphingolipid hydroxylase (fatty acid hydroxylase superfamily)
MGPTVGALLVGLLALGLVFSLIERRWPGVRGQRVWRQGMVTDLGYWFFTPLATRAIARLSLVAAVVLLAAAAGVPLDKEHITAMAQGSGRLVQRQPRWLQVLEVLLLGDLIAYWAHRLFHARALWPFHAVHHSSREVDWLSSVRLHPVNDVLTRLAQSLPLLLLGFPPNILVAYVPFLTLYALFLHANVSWDFGPLRVVLASPAFHRWHHTTEAEGLDKNFAGLFPFLDLLFGTLYLPQGRSPQRFGILGDQVPPRLWSQLAYPFRRRAGVSSDQVTSA